MYKQFLYCLVVATSMNPLSAATRAAHDRIEQEEDERGTLTKVFDVVCEAAPYLISCGALWFCYSMHQTHKEHAQALNDHAKKLNDLEKNKASADEAKANLKTAKDEAQKDRSADLDKIRKLEEELNALKSAQERQAKEAKEAAAGTQNPKEGASGQRSRSGSQASTGSGNGFEHVGPNSGDEGSTEADAKKTADKAHEKPA
jgi:DNA repair exonuclease SbcCD ATPase subunit